MPLWLIVLLGIVLWFLCAGAITIKNTLDEEARVGAQARELQSKIDEAEAQKARLMGAQEAGIWREGQPESPGDFGPQPKPLGPGDFDPVRKPNDRGRGPCNCKPGDPLCSCL